MSTAAGTLQDQPWVGGSPVVPGNPKQVHFKGLGLSFQELSPELLTQAFQLT